jgi:hypothetical protein
MEHSTRNPFASAFAAIRISAALLIALPAGAQTSIPAGTYQQSCTDSTVVDGNLVAVCKAADGQSRLATLARPQDCHGDIINANGKLQCITIKNSLLPAPAGTYQRSCKDAAIADGILLAVCQAGDGQWRPTTLADATKCNGDIANVNGKLQCVKKTTQFMSGWGVYGGGCPRGNNGTEFLRILLGGRTDLELKIVFDEPYSDGIVSIYLPQGTTSIGACGAFSTNALTYKGLE